ncbi:SGNH/GDSL hydrolase family protein [bacterium]|nr:SGNH/GDSL hydrolase family protein [bacterium]MDB4479513.1 SGNH/GDSL hydrolase family protein [Akkermansiaceae bacterium]MDB4618682.1 SGNH/GDSL hydrolase family protein [bacterium]MDB4719666.1 SGNH/GDSL hydrolase family protein [Akkermansiaceae bacterium]MDB4780924.1 SGNH/GDSL hydrolase family protein [Akkermansiaceae bacterium]
MPLRRYLLLTLLALFLGSACSAKSPEKLLFIGNSYTGGIRKMVTELIKQSPHSETKISFINPGGKTLEFHLKNKETIDKIKQGQFDLIIIQDQSQFPALFPDRFQKAAVALSEIIKKSGSKLVFYETWGRRDGDMRNKKRFPTYESMQRALSKSYRAAAIKCAADVAPVGSTWRMIREKNPKLGNELYRSDGSHPSQKGAFLAACVFYTTLFCEDPRTLKFNGDLFTVEADLIKAAAFSTRKN